jgi:hypothetical protein
MAALIVIALRLVVPLTILRWPLAGGLRLDGARRDRRDPGDAIASVLGQPASSALLRPDRQVAGPLVPSSELVVVRRWTETLVRRAAIASSSGG